MSLAFLLCGPRNPRGSRGDLFLWGERLLRRLNHGPDVIGPGRCAG